MMITDSRKYRLRAARNSEINSGYSFTPCRWKAVGFIMAFNLGNSRMPVIGLPDSRKAPEILGGDE
jgi:hypothetical protein